MLPIARHTRTSLELRDSFYDLVKIKYSETASKKELQTDTAWAKIRGSETALSKIRDSETVVPKNRDPET